MSVQLNTCVGTSQWLKNSGIQGVNFSYYTGPPEPEKSCTRLKLSLVFLPNNGLVQLLTGSREEDIISSDYSTR